MASPRASRRARASPPPPRSARCGCWRRSCPPMTGLEGKFSVQYTLAAALLDGAVTLATFTDERLARPDMQALLPKIAVTMTPAITTEYNAGRYVELDIELADGAVVHE